MNRRIVVIEPLPFWALSHSETCYRICGPWSEMGEDVAVHTTLVARPDPRRILHPNIPRWLPGAAKSRITAWLGKAGIEAAVKRALRQVRPGDICYVWPGSDSDVVARAREAGAYVVSEFINSHLALSREILLPEYERWGFPPVDISDASIAADDRRVELSHSVFSPGPLVEPSIRARFPDLAAGRIIPTSYGCHIPDEIPDRSTRNGDPIYLFVGTLNLRKGVPYLLNAWRKANLPGELWIAGIVEEWMRPLVDRLLPDRVRLFPYTFDIDAIYRQADIFVFPSLEEGGPQVTYEAAAHGLPLIVTKAGGGWINTPDTAIEVPPSSEDGLVEAMTRLGRDRDLRLALGKAARAASHHFAWNKVAERRLRDLKAAVGTFA